MAVIVLVAGSFSWQRFSLTPTPTPTPGPGNALIVTSNFNSGTVTLNGKKLAGTVPLLVRLNLGENTITFSAPPFHDKTCRVTLLAQADPNSGQRTQAAGANCAINTQEPAIRFQGIAVPNGYLGFQLTGADLPNDLRNTAENALWLKLGNLPALQVPAGDYYATGTTTTGRITSVRAAVPLLATPALVRSNSTQNGPSCSNLGCAGPPALPDQGGGSTPAGIWLIGDSVAAGWRFTTQSGALVATSAFRDAGAVAVGMTYSSTAGWSVAEGSPGPFIVDLQTQVIQRAARADSPSCRPSSKSHRSQDSSSLSARVVEFSVPRRSRRMAARSASRSRTAIHSVQPLRRRNTVIMSGVGECCSPPTRRRARSFPRCQSRHRARSQRLAVAGLRAPIIDAVWTTALRVDHRLPACPGDQSSPPGRETRAQLALARSSQCPRAARRRADTPNRQP